MVKKITDTLEAAGPEKLIDLSEEWFEKARQMAIAPCLSIQRDEESLPTTSKNSSSPWAGLPTGGIISTSHISIQGGGGLRARARHFYETSLEHACGTK